MAIGINVERMQAGMVDIKAVAILGFLSALGAPQTAEAEGCSRDAYDGNGFIVCTIDPATDDLRLFLNDADGMPYRRFSALAEAEEARGRELVFAFNAGMYGEDFSPPGLYVEDGEQARAINTIVVEGRPAQIPNFYKRPNGVFYVDDDGAGVVTTEDYIAMAPDARFATQSGPMLVIDGEFHPALIEGSSDRTRRSGVGVCEDGQVKLAATDGGINFFDFATLFRDHLLCPDALFLDGGNGVGVYHPELGRNDRSWHGGYGPMFAVVRDLGD